MKPANLDGLIGPFATVDADTDELVCKTRARFAATAFDRGDRYAGRTGRDYRVLDGNYATVPRPHLPLPTPFLGGRTVGQRYLLWLNTSRAIHRVESLMTQRAAMAAGE